MKALTVHHPDGVVTIEPMPGVEPIQHFKLEWSDDDGVLMVVARIYKGTTRTSAYVPMPEGEWPEGISAGLYSRALDMYAEDNKKQF